MSTSPNPSRATFVLLLHGHCRKPTESHHVGSLYPPKNGPQCSPRRLTKDLCHHAAHYVCLHYLCPRRGEYPVSLPRVSLLNPHRQPSSSSLTRPFVPTFSIDQPNSMPSTMRCSLLCGRKLRCVRASPATAVPVSDHVCLGMECFRSLRHHRRKGDREGFLHWR